MLWGCISASAIGTLYRIEGIMRKEDYHKILDGNLKKDARKLGLGRRWWFQQVVTEWLNKAKINVLERPSQPMLPIENLWLELKVRVNARHPTNINESEAICKRE